MPESALIAAGHPHLFVVGCARSGTTLLMRMLASHPQLALADEPHFITRPIHCLPPGTDPALTPPLVKWVLQQPRFGRLGLSDEAADRVARDAGSYREFVRRLYAEFARAQGRPFSGEKAPYYVRFLPVLHGLLPGARVVHLVRDGRDVALSLSDWARRRSRGPVAKSELGREEPIAAAALAWRERVGAGHRDGGDLGPALYQEVHYEDLVKEPEARLHAICRFLGLPYDARMLRFHEGRVRQRPGISAKSAWLPPTLGLRDWRTQMAHRDLELFEALAGGLLVDLGYPASDVEVSVETRAVAAALEQRWLTERAEVDERRRREMMALLA